MLLVGREENPMTKVNLSGMSVESLLQLRMQIDETILKRRAVLEKELEKLGTFAGERVARGRRGTAIEPISSRNCEHFLRGALSLLPVQEFVVGVARPPATTASTSWIDERGAEQATGLQLCVGSLVRECTHHQPWFSLFVRRTEHFHLPLPRSEPCRMAERRT
jgi:hypothetical protein